MNDYTPPGIWTWSGPVSPILGNRPTAGPRFQAELPLGKHPLQLYSHATQNGTKVTILLEELLEAGFDAEYDAWQIDIDEGDQFGSGFVEINPNAKIPALCDHGVSPPLRVFESGAILLYLAEKFGAFLPRDLAARTETLNWLFWQMGSAPVLGNFGHFYRSAPVKLEYAIDRFAMETKRLFDVLDRHLAGREWIAGGEYTIADIANFTWFGGLALGRHYKALPFLELEAYGNVMAWAKRIDARPAVIRGRKVNRTGGDPSDRILERHSAADFDRTGG